jgi:hypothetical protein
VEGQEIPQICNLILCGSEEQNVLGSPLQQARHRMKDIRLLAFSREPIPDLPSVRHSFTDATFGGLRRDVDSPVEMGLPEGLGFLGEGEGKENLLGLSGKDLEECLQ